MRRNLKSLLVMYLTLSICFGRISANIWAAAASADKAGIHNSESADGQEAESEEKRQSGHESESKEKAESKSKAESEREPESEAEPETKSKSQTKSESEADPEQKSESETRSEQDPKSESKSETESKPESKSGSETESKPESDPDSKSEEETDSDPKSEEETVPDPKSEEETDPDPKSEEESDPDPKSEEETDPDSKSEEETNPDSKSESESETETKPGSEAESEAESIPKSESKSEQEADPEQESDKESESESEAEPAETSEPVQSGDQSEGASGTGGTEADQPENHTEDQSESMPENKSALTEKEASPESPAFEQSAVVDGVTITVTAPEGVFPAGSVLSVEKAAKKEQKDVEKAVGKIRDKDTNVAFSYTFDIKVLDVDGNEVQPANGEKVQVRFAAADVANENLNTEVYHVCENRSGRLSAEKLEVTQDVTRGTGEKSTAVVETDGFSFYTVEFTYDLKQYVLPGGSSVALSEILEAVGLSGEVTEVYVSNEALFSASDETGEWVVTANKAFTSTEWLKVTLDGVEFEIVVTDDASVASVTSGGTTTEYSVLSDAVSAWNSAASGATLTLLADVTTGSTIKVTGTKTLDLNGHGLLRTGSENAASVISGVNAPTLTIMDSQPNTEHYLTLNNYRATGVSSSGTESISGGTGVVKVTGGYISGGYYARTTGDYHGTALDFTTNGGKLIVKGCTIIGNRNESVTHGGTVSVYHADTSAILSGTKVLYNYSGFTGGVWSSGDATVTINGGAVLSHNVGRCGAAFYFWNGNGVKTLGDCTITDNICDNNTRAVQSEHSLTFKGKPVIKNNKNGNNVSADVLLCKAGQFTIDGELSEGAEIGLYCTVNNLPCVFTSNVCSESNLAKFSSNRDEMMVGLNADGKGVLGTPVEVTYKVSHGTWSDDSTADKTETVASGAVPTSVPTGMKPFDDYTGGVWDTDPTETTITEAATFTYAFELKPPAVVTAAPEAQDLTYTESAQELVSAGTAEGGTMQYALGTDATTEPDTSAYTTAIPTATDAGTYYVWYRAKRDENHLDSAAACVTVKIKKADPDVTPPAAYTLTYNGREQELVAAGSSPNGEMQYSLSETGSYSTAIPTGTDAGEYSVWYKVVGDSNHSDTKPVKVDVTIGQKKVGLDWSDTSFTYDGESHKPSAEAEGLVDGDDCAVTVTGGQTDAGDYTATASALSNVNYKLPGANTASFTIGKKEVGLTWSDTSFTYDGESHKPSAEAEGLVDGDDCAVTVTGGQTDAGDYTATASVLSNVNYRLPVANTASFTIGKKEVGLTWSDTSFTYDGESHKPSAEAEGLVDGDDCAVTVTGGQTDAGDYTARASALTGGRAGNYKLPQNVTRSFTIGKAKPGTPRVSMENYTYGGTLSIPRIGGYDGGGAVTYYYSAGKDNSGGTKWTDSMTAKSLAAGTWYIYAVIAPTKNYLGYTTRATRFSIAKGVVTVTGSISFGDYTGTLTLSLLDCDSEETVASESIRVSGGKGTYHFQHITRGRYLLCSRWTEGGIENILKDEIEIQ